MVGISIMKKSDRNKNTDLEIISPGVPYVPQSLCWRNLTADDPKPWFSHFRVEISDSHGRFSETDCRLPPPEFLIRQGPRNCISELRRSGDHTWVNYLQLFKGLNFQKKIFIKYYRCIEFQNQKQLGLCFLKHGMVSIGGT